MYTNDAKQGHAQGVVVDCLCSSTTGLLYAAIVQRPGKSDASVMQRLLDTVQPHNCSRPLVFVLDRGFSGIGAISELLRRECSVVATTWHFGASNKVGAAFEVDKQTWRRRLGDDERPVPVALSTSSSKHRLPFDVQLPSSGVRASHVACARAALGHLFPGLQNTDIVSVFMHHGSLSSRSVTVTTASPEVRYDPKAPDVWVYQDDKMAGAATTLTVAVRPGHPSAVDGAGRLWLAPSQVADLHQ